MTTRGQISDASPAIWLPELAMAALGVAKANSSSRRHFCYPLFKSTCNDLQKKCRVPALGFGAPKLLRLPSLPSHGNLKCGSRNLLVRDVV